jgi:hypothetical protein
MAVGPGLPNDIADYNAANICFACGQPTSTVGALHAECAHCPGTHVLALHDPHSSECSLYESLTDRLVDGTGLGKFYVPPIYGLGDTDAPDPVDVPWTPEWCVANDVCRHCGANVSVVGALHDECGRCAGVTAGHIHQAHPIECTQNPLGPNYLPPQVLEVSPANGATGASRSVHPYVTFDQPMDPATITASTVQLLDHLDAPVAQTGNPALTEIGSKATIIPASSLDPTAVYRIRVTTGAKNTFGNGPAAAYTATGFTTAA